MPLPTTDVGICNLALDDLYITQKIAAMVDATEPARAASRWYDTLRTGLLKAMPWHFAGKREVLTADAVDANAHPHWQYAYVPPVGMLRGRGFVVPGRRVIPGDWSIPFEWSNLPDASAKRIYTDFGLGAVYPFAYTYDVSDVTKFPDHFIVALAAALAVKMALPLRVNEKVAKDAAEKFRWAFADAAASEGGDKTFEMPDASWIIARM